MIAGRSAPRGAVRASSIPQATAVGAASGRDLGVALHEDDVERVVEEGRAGRSGAAMSKARAVASPIRAGILDRLGRLRQRRDERKVVDLLEAAGAPAHLRGPTAEDDDRRAVGAGAGDGAHPVGDAGSRGQRADARRPRRLRPTLGGEGRGLLVADVDDRDALLAAAVIEAEEMAAREREEVGDPARAKRLGRQPAAMTGARIRDPLLLSLLLGGHGRERTRRGRLRPGRAAHRNPGWEARTGSPAAPAP